jgi:hypothetical protein
MEWWIMAAVVAGGAVAIAVIRLRQGRRRAAEPETKNIYPLW